MKLSQLLAVALSLGVKVLAAPVDTPTADAPDNENMMTVPPGTIKVQAEYHDAEFYKAYFEAHRQDLAKFNLDPALRAAIDAVDGHGPNGTEESTGKEAAPLANPQMSIEMDTERQHVGQLTSDALRYNIHRGLLDFQCYQHRRNGRNTCRPHPMAIYDIEYNAKGKKATNAHLLIWVERGQDILGDHAHDNFFPDEYPGLLDAWAFLIAAVYGRESEQNLYDIYLNRDKHWQRWGNVGLRVRLSTMNAGGAQFGLQVVFNGKTLEGDYDCNKNIWPVKQLNKDLDPDLSKAFKVRPGSLMQPNVFCNSKMHS